MIEPLVVGALLPLVLWILWRIQALVVDGVLRKGMFQLLRYQRRVYNVVSWCGVLLHELAHAIFLLLGGHGIKDFRVGRDAGHVTPRRLRKNLWGHGTFLIAALAPMFVAPVVVLALLLVARPDLVAFFPAQQPRFDAVGASFDGAPGVLLIFGSFLLGSVVPAMLGLDLAAPLGLAVFLVAVLAIPSARPSHVKNKGAEDEGDIAVLRATIKRRPWPTVAFLCLFTAASAVLAWQLPAWFWWGALALVAVPVAGITLAGAGGIGWWAVSHAGRITPWLAWIPFALAMAAQVVPRMVGWGTPLLLNLGTLLLFVASTLMLRVVASRA